MPNTDSIMYFILIRLDIIIVGVQYDTEYFTFNTVNTILFQTDDNSEASIHTHTDRGRMEVYKVTLEMKMGGNMLSSGTGGYMYVGGHVSMCVCACVCWVLCPIIIPTLRLIPRLLLDLLRRGLATGNTLLWPKWIESFNQVLMFTHTIIGGVRSYHAALLVCKLLFALLDHGNSVVLGLVCGDVGLTCEWKVLNSTNSWIQYKVAVTDPLPIAPQILSWRLLLLFRALATFLDPSNIKSLQDATASSACSRLMCRVWIL